MERSWPPIRIIFSTCSSCVLIPKEVLVLSRAGNTVSLPPPKKAGIFSRYWKYRSLVMLFLPAILYYILFKYIPIFGVQIAFKKYMFRLGIWGSPWVGFENFEKLFAMNSFWEVLRNTFMFSGLKLLFWLPLRPSCWRFCSTKIRKTLSLSASYRRSAILPHFLSWVILSGIFNSVSPSFHRPINIFHQRPWADVPSTFWRRKNGFGPCWSIRIFGNP